MSPLWGVNYFFSFTSGNSLYCWISDGRAIAVAVVTPVSLALLFNVMCLAKNMRAIRHLQQVGDITAVTYLVVGSPSFSKGTDTTPK